MIPQTYQSADNITFHWRKISLMTDSNKFVSSWCNTCHIIIGCAPLCTYVVIYALHKHYEPKENGWSNRNRSHMYSFLQGLGNIYTILLLYFVIYIDITLETHSLFGVILILRLDNLEIIKNSSTFFCKTANKHIFAIK